MSHDLERACALLGPLEARIMRLVWSGDLPEQFIVHDVHLRFPDLAYTTVMTTLNRLAAKRLLVRQGVAGKRAHVYQRDGDPTAFLAAASRTEVDTLVARYGDAALAALTARLDPADCERLRRLAET